MGFAISWCAVHEPAADSFLQRLGLVGTGETEEIPESLICVARLSTRWRLLRYDAYDCPFLVETELREHSRHHDILYCQIEEHCMASSSEYWSEGSQKWRISHEGDDGPKGLDVSGDPPAVFPQIKEEMETKQVEEGGEQAEIDYIFEIPLLVAKSMTGFKHDDDDCPDEFEIMSRPSPRGGLFSRLFRKK